MPLRGRRTMRSKKGGYTRKRGGGVPTFHFLLTSAGRPSIKGMLDSLKGELKDGDAVTLLFDGENAPKDAGYSDAWKAEMGNKLNVITEKEALGNWGHSARNVYQSKLEPKTTFVLHGDDDDVYNAGFLQKLRDKCTNPETLYVAKMGFKHENTRGEVIPKYNAIEKKNIGTPNGIIPYDLVGKAEWLPKYGGDFDYYSQLSKVAKRVEFLEDVIYTVLSDVEEKPNFNTYVFYHIYCNKHTMPIVLDQVTKIIYSGLYEYVHGIKCFLAGEEEYIKKIKELLHQHGSKFKIEKVGKDDKTFERFTLTEIPRYIGPDDLFLYIHSKGVSDRHAANDNVYWWRSWMEYNLIFRFKYCIEALETYNLVGVGYTTKMIGPHFSGNFWWTKGSYYLTLPKEIGNGYTDPENYIFKGTDPSHIDIDKGRTPNENDDFYGTKQHFNRMANSRPAKQKGGAEKEKKVTVVTAYYPVKTGKHTREDYTKWMTNFFNNVTCDVVVFCATEVEQEIRGLAKKNVDVQVRPFDSWDMMSPKRMNVWRKLHDTNVEKGSHSPELYAVWAAKQEFVREGMGLKGHRDSEIYVWCDIGCLRSPAMPGSFKRTGDYVEPGKITCLHVAGTIGGGVLAGDKDAWEEFSNSYLEHLDTNPNLKNQNMYKIILNGDNAKIIQPGNFTLSDGSAGDPWFYLVKLFSDGE